MTKLLLKITTVAVFLTLIMSGCATESAPTHLSEEDYLSALEGIAVTTTIYHQEVMPVVPGSRYPPTLYDPILIGTRPPDVTGSITLQPFGQLGDYENLTEVLWLPEGNTFDILLEANAEVLFELDTPNCVRVDMQIGSGAHFGKVGVGWTGGFFWEGKRTEVKKTQGGSDYRYSTAYRVISWDDGYLSFHLWNYNPDEPVNITYNIWRGGFVTNFVSVVRQWEEDFNNYWDDYAKKHGQECAEGTLLEMKQAMEQYLAERW